MTIKIGKFNDIKKSPGSDYLFFGNTVVEENARTRFDFKLSGMPELPDSLDLLKKLDKGKFSLRDCSFTSEGFFSCTVSVEHNKGRTIGEASIWPQFEDRIEHKGKRIDVSV